MGDDKIESTAAAKKAKMLKREEELEKAINGLQIIIDTARENETEKKRCLEN